MKRNKTEVTIIGSGTCTPTAGHGMPGILIKTDAEQLLFDSGSGTLHTLTENGYDYRKLNYLFYTHTHPDHVIDLIPILQAIRYDHRYHRTEPIYIFGPSGFKDFMVLLSDAFGKWILASDDYEIQIRELHQDKLSLPFGQITTAPMQHSRATVGYRLDATDGTSITYSGDTDYCKEIIELASGTDILILECSTPDNLKMDGHLTPSLAAKIASQAACKQLVLTHLYPVFDHVDVIDICKKYFSGSIKIARDLMRI